MRKKTILCVDDEYTILDGLKEQLRRLLGREYTIEVAESGEEALNVLDEISAAGGEVPIIISDQIMPGIKGDELLTTVHGSFPNTLKIFLTGRANAEDLGNVVNNASLYRYIGKPWDKEDLDLTIREALRSYDQEKELASHREHLEQLIKQKTEELERAQKELVLNERLAFIGQLTSVIGHKLRNPLGTIRTSIFAISESHCSQDPLVKRSLDRAERNVIRCDQIIEQLLEYSRTRQGHRELIVLDDWITHFINEYSLPDGVSINPRLNADVKTRLDGERFRRCLVNVMDNACEAMLMRQGQEEKRNNQITIASHKEDDRVEISIVDTGCGIPVRDQEKILTPPSSPKTANGIGLGLPIVNQIMEQHNGGVKVHSKVGQGTKITLWLPINN